MPPNLVLLGLVFDMDRGVLPKDALMWLWIDAKGDSVNVGGAPQRCDTNDRTCFWTVRSESDMCKCRNRALNDIDPKVHKESALAICDWNCCIAGLHLATIQVWNLTWKKPHHFKPLIGRPNHVFSALSAQNLDSFRLRDLVPCVSRRRQAHEVTILREKFERTSTLCTGSLVEAAS